MFVSGGIEVVITMGPTRSVVASTRAGTCVSFEAESSSGSDLDAGGLRCENVKVHASSGSDMTVAATRGVTGEASSGSDVRVRGGQALTVQVKTSSGAGIEVRE